MPSRPWFTTGSRRTRFVAISGALTYVTGVLAVSLDRYGLVGPTAVVAGLFAFTLFRLWQARQNPAVLLVGDPFQLYLVAWPARVVGALERYVRNAVDERDTTESAG